MLILDRRISREELCALAEKCFGDMVKGVEDEEIRGKIEELVTKWIRK